MPLPPSAPIVTARGVTKAYGATSVLRDVEFDMSNGVTGLLGSNGAGKTTLIGLMLGLHRRDGGTLSVLGFDPEGDGSALRQRIGYSPEHHLLPPDVQAMDLVRHLTQLHGIEHLAATERASDALWQVGLGEERFRPIGTMSTGQRQRVKLASAFAHDPDLMILDEPTDGLDPMQRDDMLDLIGRIAGDFGIDVILTSHLLDEVERVCDHVVILGEGRVTRSTTLSDLVSVDDRLDVELHGDASAVGTMLHSVGFEVAVDGVRLAIGRGTASPEISLLDAVRDAIVASSASLYRLEAQRRTLTDVYLELG
ncbi:MAG: ABC transporter ATP-binding protein [Acidobacteria bacterium]|nr:ABC transporter ATP-binding protein [Acidobacteriota bacterium]